jgi:hypothetical protein
MVHNKKSQSSLKKALQKICGEKMGGYPNVITQIRIYIINRLNFTFIFKFMKLIEIQTYYLIKYSKRFKFI